MWHEALLALFRNRPSLAANAAARKEFENMLIEGYEYQSNFAKEFYGKGKQEGTAVGMRQLIVEALQARFGRLPALVRERIDCAGAEQLRHWGSALWELQKPEDLLD